MRNTSTPLRGTLAALIVAGVFTGGFYVGAKANNGEAVVPLSFFNGGTPPPEGVDFTAFWEAWSVLEERFVPATTTQQVSSDERVWGAIQGLTEAYGDPYTIFLPPEDKAFFEEEISGNFEGVGMEIGIRDDILTVVSPLKGSPAEKAGIETGDRILEINGKSTDGITIDRAVKNIRGEGGTDVTFTIARNGAGELLTISVTREVIQIPTIDTELRDDGVFVISLYNFSAISANLFREALREFVVAKTNKLIIDLRGNPGGFLESSVDIASWFLPAGKTVVTEDFGTSDTPRAHRSRGYNIFNDNLKLAILVNQGSASASEILAGALQEYDKAIIVGTNTFGKGSVQELVEITNNTSLKITIARWVTPNGISISESGIKPDVEVEISDEDAENGIDSQLEKAVELLAE